MENIREDFEAFKKQIEENNKKEQERKEKRKSCLKKIAIGVTGVSLFVGGYYLVKNTQHKLKNDTPKLPNSVSDTTYTKWSDKYFEELVTQYMFEHPNMDEDVVRNYLAVVYQDELMKHNPDLLYELTGIYEYEELTDEKFYELVNKTYATLRRKEINVTVEDVTKFVTIINIDQLAQDNQDLLTSIVGNQNAGQIITDTFKITSAIKDNNYRNYEKTKSTADLIRVSDFIFDKKAQADLALIEEYADKANAVRGNKEKQDAIVSELLDEIYHSSGKLFYMEAGVGFASRIPISAIINNITFNDKGVRIISQENFDLLMTHDTSEVYLSNIYANLNKCTGKTLKK